MAIDESKILSIPLRDWINFSSQETLADYDFVGVHLSLEYSYRGSDTMRLNNLIREFAERVPSEAILVVEYRLNSCGSGQRIHHSYFINQTGLALIPNAKPLD